MTVKIANLTAQFANSDITYVGIGLHVIDGASAPDSKILNFSVNSNNKFSIGKEGTVIINGYVPDNIELMNIRERGNNLVRITNNVAAMNTTTYVKSYAEGYIEIGRVPGGPAVTDLVIDLSKASVFGTYSNIVSSITFVPPNTLHNKREAYSCSIIFYDSPWFTDTQMWENAGVKWSYGNPPRDEGYPGEGPMILTFLNINHDDIWYGTISGVDFQYYAE